MNARGLWTSVAVGTIREATRPGTIEAAADVAQLVEQRFRKPPVGSSSLPVGSGRSPVAHAVKWGILSTGNINRKVIPGAHASSKVALVPVAGRDQARADAYAKNWEI